MNVDLWSNLVNIVFVNPIFFAIVLGAIFLWFATVYDVSYWTGLLFGGVLISWLGIVLVGEWILIPVLIGTSFFVAIQIFRRIRS